MKRKILLFVLGAMTFMLVVGLVSAWREPFPPFNDDDPGDDDPSLFVIPEPGTVVGLVTALSALGVLALKKRRG